MAPARRSSYPHLVEPLHRRERSGTAVAIGPDTEPAAPGPVRNQQVAIDANGNALAVWPHADGGNYRIWSNHYTTGMGWGTAESIEVNASTGASDVSAIPQIKFDPNGNSIALWERSDGVHSRVWSNRYTVGAGWNTAAIPIDDNGGEAGSAQIAFDANGDAIAVWDQLDDAGFHIWANRYTAAAGSWSTAQMIQSDDVVQAFSPQIGIDRAGNALVDWNQSHGAMQTEIWANRYTAANGGWGTAGRISDKAGGAGNPHIATDVNGDALVVWPQVDNSTSSSVRWNRYTAGTGWGTAAQIEPSNGTYVGIRRLPATRAAMRSWCGTVRTVCTVRSDLAVIRSVVAGQRASTLVVPVMYCIQ